MIHISVVQWARRLAENENIEEMRTWHTAAWNYCRIRNGLASNSTHRLRMDTIHLYEWILARRYTLSLRLRTRGIPG